LTWSKAYDTVPRDLLWYRLQHLGMHGRMLLALQGMYSHVEMCVKVGHAVSDFFPCYRGVRQGCPLSPNLFGLFIDTFQQYVDELQPGSGPLLPLGIRVPCLIYADDIVLLGESAEELQQLIDVMQRFCRDWHLTVNMDKSKIVVFRQRNTPVASIWTYGGQRVPVADEYRYLGLHFHATKRLRYMQQQLAVQARKAMIAMFTRAADMKLRRDQPALFFRLFDTLVTSVASHACPIWCTHMTSSDEASANPLEHVHTGFMRHFWGLRGYVSPWILYEEHDRLPLLVRWWKQTLQFWNKLVRAPGTSLVQAVLAQNIADVARGSQHNWSAGILKFVRTVRSGYSFTAPLPLFSISEHVDMYTEYLRRVWNGLYLDPASATARVRMCIYFNWFQRREGKPFFVSAPAQLRFRAMSLLLRFRTGCHRLAVETGRWNGVPRANRTCTLCSLGKVQDERHITFDCPALQDVRDRYRKLFAFSTMRTFYNNNSVAPLAAFLSECLQRVKHSVPHQHP
jgi:hypothetical protein